MAGFYLDARREFLIRTQNIDGGWGYFPGKSSWLEPTAYAVLALHGAAPEATRRAWTLVATWRLPDGSWRAGAQVQDATWVSALGVTLCLLQGEEGPALTRGLDYLLRTKGEETSAIPRILGAFGLGRADFETTHSGWPWRRGNSSWIEPTAHTLVAIKNARRRVNDGRIALRIGEGEKMILSRRCFDGGWNHGAPRSVEVDAPSYPESTALALLGLQGRTEARSAVALSRSFWNTTKSPLAKAWLTIVLRTWDDTLQAPEDFPPAEEDVMLAALEALAHPDGNHRLLRTDEAT